MELFYNCLEKILDSIVCKMVKPNMEIECVTDLNEDELNNLISYGIEGVIIDVDETIRYNSEDISKDCAEWLDLLTSKFNVVALSDGYDNNIKSTLKGKNIDYIGFGFKPFRPSFLFACFKLRKTPMKVAVIGDDLWADIHGGNKNFMTTIKVSGVKKYVK